MNAIRLSSGKVLCFALLLSLMTADLLLNWTASGMPAAKALPGEVAYSFVNGQWFDGNGFTRETWYAVEGKLAQTRPAGPIETIDLAGAYILPPFGEAHNHNVEGEWNAEAIIARYLTDGVFYVKNPNDVRDFALQIRDKINLPRSIDVAFAHAGLTGSGGHPIALYEDILRRHRYEPVIGSIEHGWFENRAYVIVNTEQDLHDKWPLITDGNPDFVKAYLAHSEGRQAEAAAPGRHGTSHARTGVNPALLPAIVAKAHGAGLRVSIHVETAADFRTAVQAEADEIAHLPGWLVESEQDIALVRLSEEDALLAAKKQVVVVTTTVAGEAMPGHDAHAKHAGDSDPRHDAILHARTREVQRDNLRLLHRYGVKLAIGSDHAETSVAEALSLKALDIFDNVTLLNLWCETTPTAIFPGRQIGRFAEGYEASFLALDGDPILNFEYVRAIRLRAKQGILLDAPR